MIRRSTLDAGNTVLLVPICSVTLLSEVLGDFILYHVARRGATTTTSREYHDRIYGAMYAIIILIYFLSRRGVIPSANVKLSCQIFRGDEAGVRCSGFNPIGSISH